MVAMNDIIECTIDNQILGNLIIQSDAQVGIYSLVRIGIAHAQEWLIRVVQAMQQWLRERWHRRIEWVLRHFSIIKNEKANQVISK
jgi:hypothetical protein